jgi:pilus assembly protein CpaF
VNLASRLEAARGRAPQPEQPSTAAAVPPPRHTAVPPPATDALTRLKDRVGKALFERMGSRLADPTVAEEQLRALVLAELDAVVEEEKVPLSGEERQRLTAELADDVLGLGPLQRLLDDPTVTEIMVNGPDMVYVEQGGKLTRTAARFTGELHLRRVIDRIVSRVGRRIDESSPLVDARLADGSRVNAIIPPLAFSGSTLTIRKFAKDPFTVEDLLGFGTLSPEMAELLRACVEARLNVIVSGGTGTGKTTLDICTLWHTSACDRSRCPTRLEGWCADRLRRRHRHGPGRRLLPDLR